MTLILGLIPCPILAVAQSLAPVVKVTEARLLKLDSTDASLDQRWAPISGMLDPSYRAFQANGMQQTVSANGIAKRTWQFVRVILVLTNTSKAKQSIHLCGNGEACPNIALIGASGAAVPVWEIVTAGMFSDVNGFRSTMQEHAKGVLLRHEYKGDLYADLDPGQRTWVAVLFDAASDPGKCTLRVFERTLPVTIAR